jgi:predicted methyltransferase
VRIEEASVKPGINDSYLQDPSVDSWIKRFEVESREIWVQRRRIVETAGVRRGMAVADIGAGTGFLTRLLAKEAGKTGVVYAVDIMPSFLDHIAAKAKEEGQDNIRTVLCREDSVELPPSSVDLAFVCDTYHHLEYPRSTLASIHRALRRGGWLVVVDFIRIPGKSRQWILDHVRAGEDTVTAEIESAGFERCGEARFLRENYILRFRRVP